MNEEENKVDLKKAAGIAGAAAAGVATIALAVTHPVLTVITVLLSSGACAGVYKLFNK